MSITTHETKYVEPPKGSKRRQLLKLCIALAVVLAIGAGIGLVGGADDDGDGQVHKSGPVVPKNSLAVGEASADQALATTVVGGAQRGFPHTEAGAVEAAAAASAGTARMLNHSATENAAFIADAFTNAPDIQQRISKKKTELGLGETGQLAHPLEGDRYYNESLFQFGAYRINSSSADAVAVSVWDPNLYGQGRPENIEKLYIQWYLSTYEMRWTNGDWRVSNGYGDDSAKAPLPPDINRVDVSFKARRDLLGKKWMLFQGATEKWPVSLLGPEPQGSVG